MSIVAAGEVVHSSVDEEKIAHLRGEAFRTIGDNEQAKAAVDAAFDAYEEATAALQDEVDSHEREAGDVDHIKDAVDAFCDVIERPVGKLTFIVPQTDEVNRAIRGLHDAIGRNI